VRLVLPHLYSGKARMLQAIEFWTRTRRATGKSAAITTVRSVERRALLLAKILHCVLFQILEQSFRRSKYGL